jgi:hypothetical protein
MQVLIPLISLLVLLFGLILYYRNPPADPRTANVGLHMFWVGLLVFLFQLTPLIDALRTNTLHHI